jgi:hypothetical protein
MNRFLGHSTIKGSRRAVWLPAITVGIVCLSLALSCLSSLAMLDRRISLRPIVLHLDRVALSAEITVDPSCAPLVRVCWVHQPDRRAKYLSVWVYMTHEQRGNWQISSWQIITLRLGLEGLSTATK